jgi:hypothetical protein
VETDGGVVFAYFLYRLNRDELAVDVVTEFLKCFSNLDAVDRAKDSAGGACLGANGEFYALQSCGSYQR